MAYKDGHASSVGSKLLLVLLTLLGVIISNVFLVKNNQIDFIQKVLLFFCVDVFYFRLVICLFVFVKRKVSWFEGSVVGLLYGILAYAFTFWGSINSITSDFLLIIGVTLFLIGSFINSLSDYQRFLWKKRPENFGKIYTEGLFRYAMHINFFGDSVMFIGFAMVTQNSTSFIPVIVIMLNFIFIQIPQLDDYLKNKYGNDFIEYALKTKKFIPFIY